MSATLGEAAREQARRDLVGLALADADFRDFLTTRTTHLDRELAAVYGVPAPARQGFREVELPADLRRRGLLGEVGFLALQSHPVSSSPTLRGKFVRERILCHDIPPPPAGVNTAIPEPDPSRPTMRDRIAVHLEAPACAGCHGVTDPVGLAFENFDGIGRWRTTENGVTIDASGDLDDAAVFADAWELAGVLHDHPDVPPCLVRNVWTFAEGRQPTAGEEPVLDFLTETFAWSGYRMRHLLVELVASPAFREVGPDAAEEAP